MLCSILLYRAAWKLSAAFSICLQYFFGGHSVSDASLWKRHPPWRQVWNGISQHKLCSRFYIHAPSAVRFFSRFAYSSPFQIQNHFMYQNRLNGRLLAQLHGSFTPAHADGCGAQCFEGVQRASIFNLPVRRRPQAATLVLRPGFNRSPV